MSLEQTDVLTAEPAGGRLRSRLRWALLAFAIATVAVWILYEPSPEYLAAATVGVSSSGAESGAPAVTTLDPLAAMNVIKRASVVESTVARFRLFIRPQHIADSLLVDGIAIKQRFLPATYTLTLDDRASHWFLSIPQRGSTPTAPYRNVPVDSGTAGDSIGSKFGLNWRPEPAMLARYAGHDVTFTVATPYATWVALKRQVEVDHPQGSDLLRFSLSDGDPRLAARAVNGISRGYVAAASMTDRGRLTLRDSATTSLVAAKSAMAQRLGVAVASGATVAVFVALLIALIGWVARPWTVEENADALGQPETVSGR